MARTPSYPRDAPVAPPPGSTDANPPAPSDPPKAPKPSDAGKAPPDSKRTKHLVAGAAIGIGSAALVAALLYANRSKRS
jgi:hypothetical protein